MKKTVYNGCDLLNSNVARNLLQGKRLGLVTNFSAVARDEKTTLEKLNELYKVSALFSPEHGIFGKLQAGEYDKHSFTTEGIPVYSLFGEDKNSESVLSAFSELDAVVFDIQDIGCRYYTYQYTLLDTMYICKSVGLPLIILDRLNPLGGIRVEGNLLEADCVSEVGRVAGQPTVSGLTIGELGYWYNDYMNIKAGISVINCENWNRSVTFDDTDLVFTPPSPNMRNTDALFLYAGTCLFEGTNLSEGRGTDKPFQMFGAPWIEPKRVIDALDTLPYEAKRAFHGLRFKPCNFTPTFSDYAGELCQGIEIEIKSRKNAYMYEIGLYLIEVLRELYPQKLEFSEHLTFLAGTKSILNTDFNTKKYLQTQNEKIALFKKEIAPYLIY